MFSFELDIQLNFVLILLNEMSFIKSSKQMNTDV